MINNKFIKILFVTIFFLNSFYFSQAATTTDGIDIDLNVNNCNNNNICEPLFENSLSCPNDCIPICNNNNICEAGENSLSCPTDCPPPVCNNNNICEGGEDNLNCPADCPVVPPNPSSKSSSGSLAVGSFFNDLTIEAGKNSAIIKWSSSIPTMSTVKWGTTNEYKSGTIKNINFISNHKIEIFNLKSNIVYYFSIQSEDTFKRSRLLDNQYFKTQASADSVVIGNPFNVSAVSTLSGISISWSNPTDKDFDYIRVMKNTDRFYSDPSIGSLVYEGKGRYFTDGDVVVNNKYYYSLFSRNTKGDYSSGSLVSLVYKKIIKESDPIVIPDYPEIKEPILPVSNIYLIKQGLYTYDFKLGGTTSLNAEESIILKTNYSPVDKNDDLWVEISNFNRDIVGRYFFGESKDDAGFLNANIPSLEKSGYYRVAIYRYINDYPQIINQGAFQIYGASEPGNGSNNKLYFIIFFIFITLFILWLLIFIFIILKKKFK